MHVYETIFDCDSFNTYSEHLIILQKALKKKNFQNAMNEILLTKPF